MNKKRIFIYGAGIITQYLPYIKSLIDKEKPKMCLLPTAVADNPYTINNWYERCHQLSISPFVQRMFISSYDQKVTFEEVLLNMDAILVTGGNTLNMMAIWKAQGIDRILKDAWEKGILLSGGSAGSLCWFEHGTTDSRPKEISIVECLGFLEGSHCPHYDSETSRKPLYHHHIKSGSLKPGFAVDDRAAILFNDQQVEQVVALNEESNAYYIGLEGGEIFERRLEKTVIKL